MSKPADLLRWSSRTLTFRVVNVGGAYLVHQQHEDEAEDQGDADAGVQLLVAVLVLPADAQSCLRLHLRLGRVHHPGLPVAVVSACKNEIKKSGFSMQLCLNKHSFVRSRRCKHGLHSICWEIYINDELFGKIQR